MFFHSYQMKTTEFLLVYPHFRDLLWILCAFTFFHKLKIPSLIHHFSTESQVWMNLFKVWIVFVEKYLFLLRPLTSWLRITLCKTRYIPQDIHKVLSFVDIFLCLLRIKFYTDYNYVKKREKFALDCGKLAAKMLKYSYPQFIGVFAPNFSEEVLSCLL